MRLGSGGRARLCSLLAWMPLAIGVGQAAAAPAKPAPEPATCENGGALCEVASPIQIYHTIFRRGILDLYGVNRLAAIDPMRVRVYTVGGKLLAAKDFSAVGGSFNVALRLRKDVRTVKVELVAVRPMGSLVPGATLTVDVSSSPPGG